MSKNQQAVRDPSKNCYAYNLIAYRGLRRLARTYCEGRIKYGANNWRKGGQAVSIPELLNHAMSHVAAYMEAFNTEQPPSEDDLAHAVWNLWTAMHFEETVPVYPMSETGEPQYVVDAFTENTKGR